VSDVPERNLASWWVDGYTANYHYARTWLVSVFPMLGLLGVYLGRQSTVALVVAMGAEILFVLVLLDWKTYYIRLSGDSIRRGSCLRGKTIPLAQVDHLQQVYGGRGERILYVRHGDKILLRVYQELAGFDDLVGFFREYARHHHIIFATRDAFGKWTWADPRKKTSPYDQP
jgi:hypothetical protein